jgi:serine/threonine protein kinase
MHAGGLPTLRPYGFAELTPEQEYLLVTEFFDGAVELGEAEIDDRVIDDGLALIRAVGRRLVHRDIKPANLLVRDAHLLLIDVLFFTEVHLTPWRQAVDLANMMLCLSLRSDPQRVHDDSPPVQRGGDQRGLRRRTRAGPPVPLRRMLRDQGRDLHGEFLNLLPERPQPIRIQR